MSCLDLRPIPPSLTMARERHATMSKGSEGLKRSSIKLSDQLLHLNYHDEDFDVKRKDVEYV